VDTSAVNLHREWAPSLRFSASFDPLNFSAHYFFSAYHFLFLLCFVILFFRNTISSSRYAVLNSYLRHTICFSPYDLPILPLQHFFFFPVPVCAITAPGVPGGTLVSMNHFYYPVRVISPATGVENEG
jgi:hypothetical protein